MVAPRSGKWLVNDCADDGEDYDVAGDADAAGVAGGVANAAADGGGAGDPADVAGGVASAARILLLMTCCWCC